MENRTVVVTGKMNDHDIYSMYSQRNHTRSTCWFILAHNKQQNNNNPGINLTDLMVWAEADLY